MDGPRYLDDLAVGDRFAGGAHALDADRIRTFAAAFDPQPFHLDDESARGSLFGGLAASGWHTAAVTMRLLVETVPFAGGLIGSGGTIAWPRPTQPEHVGFSRHAPLPRITSTFMRLDGTI